MTFYNLLWIFYQNKYWKNSHFWSSSEIKNNHSNKKCIENPFWKKVCELKTPEGIIQSNKTFSEISFYGQNFLVSMLAWWILHLEFLISIQFLLYIYFLHVISWLFLIYTTDFISITTATEAATRRRNNEHSSRIK